MAEIPRERRIHEKEIEEQRVTFEKGKEKAGEVSRNKEKCVGDKEAMQETLTSFNVAKARVMECPIVNAVTRIKTLFHSLR